MKRLKKTVVYWCIYVFLDKKIITLRQRGKNREQMIWQNETQDRNGPIRKSDTTQRQEVKAGEEKQEPKLNRKWKKGNEGNEHTDQTESETETRKQRGHEENHLGRPKRISIKNKIKSLLKY